MIQGHLKLLVAINLPEFKVCEYEIIEINHVSYRLPPMLS
jgi:hypothetical protein